MIITTRRCVVCKNHVPRSKVKIIVHTHSLCIGISCSAQVITKPRQCVLCKNHAAMSKVKFTVRTYSLWIGLNETYSCLAHNFVAGPASRIVRYKDLVFHPLVRSHQGDILLKALGRGISFVWTDSFSYSGYGLVLFLKFIQMLSVPLTI